MSRADVWVSVTCTDRAASLHALALELVQQSAVAGVRLSLLVNDNSVAAAERDANLRLAHTLRSSAVAVELVASSSPGASIAASRCTQRHQIMTRLSAHPRPAFIWMLDDDVRLSHLLWTGECVVERPLHCHLTFLLELAGRHPELDVLIGEVCGDPPIPVFGTVVSRLADLEASLRTMFASEPDDVWRVPATALARLQERDAYYDLSVERPPGAWSQAVHWLPRGATLTTSAALAQMLGEVEHIPRGAAFSRPILASPGRFAQLTARPSRGANAVFFDVDRCVEHEYPSVTVSGIETRRSDMIGTHMLSAAGAEVRGAGFSVLHRRPRDTRWPTSAALLESMVADTLGAWLARRSDPQAAESFLSARLLRLEVAAAALGEICERLRGLVDRSPGWVPDLEPVLGVVDWAMATFPGARDGAVPRAVVELLLTGDQAA